MIDTERLHLRRLDERDAPALAEAANDYEIAKWLTRLPHPYSVVDALEFIPRAHDLTFAVFMGDRMIGMLGMDSARELGYWFVQDVWGQGVATEAGLGYLRHYFERHDETLISGYILGNHRSERVLTKLGFEKTNLVTEPALLRKEVRIQKMVLGKERWNMLKKAA
ncbi:MAG: GNAT family N-acetyltransferase [Pseudomonadota bacterium]